MLTDSLHGQKHILQRKKVVMARGDCKSWCWWKSDVRLRWRCRHHLPLFGLSQLRFTGTAHIENIPHSQKEVLTVTFGWEYCKGHLGKVEEEESEDEEEEEKPWEEESSAPGSQTVTGQAENMRCKICSKTLISNPTCCTLLRGFRKV